MLIKKKLKILIKNYLRTFIFTNNFFLVKQTNFTLLKQEQSFLIYKCFFKITKNNFFMNILDKKKQTIFFYSGGQKKKNSTISKNAFSGLVLGELTGSLLKKLNVKFLTLHIQGFSFIKKQFLQGLLKYRLNILSIEEITPIPHNGCKIKKKKSRHKQKKKLFI